MTKNPFVVLFVTRSFPLRDPFAGIFNKEYLNFLTRRCVIFQDGEALYCLKDNAWMAEGKLELMRQLELPAYRKKLIAKMQEKGVIFSTNPDDYFLHGNNPRLSRRFFQSLDDEVIQKE